MLGKEINLTGDSTTITSNNFSVDSNGNMTCNNANIKGAIKSGSTIEGSNITGSSITTPKFTVDSNGNMACTDANVSGTITSNNANITGGRFIVNASSGTNVVQVRNKDDINEQVGIQYDGVFVYNNSGNAGISSGGISAWGSGVSSHFTKSDIIHPAIWNKTTSSSPNVYIDNSGYFYRSTSVSSQRYKTNIKDIEDEKLDPHKLYNLKVKQFKYKEEFLNKNDARYNKNLIGFIAEEVEKIYPIATDYEKDKDGNIIVENWNERYIIPAMLKLVQEQHEQIEQLQKEIKELKEGK